MVHALLVITLLFTIFLRFACPFTSISRSTTQNRFYLQNVASGSYSSMRVSPCISSLDLKDLLDVWMLASQEFTPNCSNHFQAFSLNLKIFLYSLAKLSVPKLWGHAIYGLRMINEKKLIGMVDLSAQVTSGSLSALKLTTLSSRLVQIEFSKRYRHLQKLNQQIPSSLQPYICNLLVEKGSRRKGYAKMLLDHCATVAESQGFSSLHLHVQSTDIPALALYTKFGFNVVGRIGHDVLYLRKDLKTE